MTTKTNTAEQPVNTLTPNGNLAFLWYGLSVLVLIVDQVTKHYFNNTLVEQGNSIEVINPVLNWTLAYNYGAAFSFLADQGGWQKIFFAVLAATVSFFLIWYLRTVPKQAKLASLALALVLGGAVGNLVDRVLFGYVIDFIHVHYADAWHYPIFNLADCGIVIGVIFLIYDMLFLEPKRQ